MDAMDLKEELTFDDMDKEEDVEALLAMLPDQSSDESDGSDSEEDVEEQNHASPSEQISDIPEDKKINSESPSKHLSVCEEGDATEKKEEIYDELDKAMIEIHDDQPETSKDDNDGVIEEIVDSEKKEEVIEFKEFKKADTEKNEIDIVDLEKEDVEEKEVVFDDLEKAMDAIHNESDYKDPDRDKRPLADDLNDDCYNMDDMDSQETIDLMLQTQKADLSESGSDDSDKDDEDVVMIPDAEMVEMKKAEKLEVTKLDSVDDMKTNDEKSESALVEEAETIISGDICDSIPDFSNDSIVDCHVDKVSTNTVGMQEIFTEPESILIQNDVGDFEDIVVPNKDANFVASIDIAEEESNLCMPSLSANERASADVPDYSAISLEKFKAMQSLQMSMHQSIQNPDDDDDEGDYCEDPEEYVDDNNEGENVEDLFTQKELEEDCNNQLLDLDRNFDEDNEDRRDVMYDDTIESEDEKEDSDYEYEDEDKEEKEIFADDLKQTTGPVTFNNVRKYQHSFLDEIDMMITEAKKRLGENIRRQQEIDAEVQDNGLEAPVATVPSGRHVSVAKKTLTVFGAPYFKDHRLFSHPKNDDAKKKQGNKELDVYITYPHCWTTAKRTKLAASVREDAVKKRQKALIQKRENYTQDIKSPGATEEEKEEIKALIDDVDRKLSDIAKLPDDKLFIDRDEDFDWMKISSQESGFSEEFSAKGCELQWKNQLHPSINTGSFSKEEDDLLKLLAKATDATGWDNIAKELGTGRTGIGCFMRYMEKHNVSVNNRKWEHSEDERLRRIVASCRINNHIPWSKVSFYIDNRTKDQCYQRYLYSLKDDLRQGAFVAAEDFLIIIGYKRYGKAWHKICETIPGRSGVQLHARWNAFLSVDFKNWTQDEDLQLLGLVKKNGARDWVAIANQMEGRNFKRSEVRNRFNFLMRNYKRNTDFVLDNIKYKSQNDPGIAARRHRKIFIQMKQKFKDWMTEEGLNEEDIDQEDPTGPSVRLFHNKIVGNLYVEKFVRYIQQFLPEPEEPRPLAPLQAPLPRAVAHLEEKVFGPNRKVMNKLKQQRKKKKFKKLPVFPKKREVYRHKVDRDIAKFFRCTWVGKGGKPRSNYTNQEIEQHTNAVVKLGEILDFSKLNLKPPHDEMEPKEKSLYRDYRYYQVHGKKQNQFDPETGQTTMPEEAPTDLSIHASPVKIIRTYSRKNKKSAASPKSPSISNFQAKQRPLKEGEKRLNLLMPNNASMVGFRGQLLHTRYINSLANPFLDEERNTPSQKTTDRLVQEGIFNTDILTKIAEQNGHANNVTNDGDAGLENEGEPGTLTREQSDQLLVQRFTQIFLLPALLSCKKPARQEQLFENCEFLDTEPVSASNPYDTTEIIRSIEKPRAPLRKPRPHATALTPRKDPFFTNPNTPSTSQEPVWDSPYIAPESPITPKRPPQPHSPPPPTYERPQHAHASVQRPPPMSAILQKPLQTPGPSHHIQPPGTPQMTSTPQQYPSIYNFTNQTYPPQMRHQHPSQITPQQMRPQHAPQVRPQYPPQMRPQQPPQMRPQQPPQMRPQQSPQMRTIHTLRPVLRPEQPSQMRAIQTLRPEQPPQMRPTPILRPVQRSPQTSRPVPDLRPLQASQIVQRPLGPRPTSNMIIMPKMTPGSPYILPKVKIPANQVRSSFIPSNTSSPATNPSQQTQSPKTLVHSTPKSLLPILKGEPAEPINRKRPAEEQPVSDKAIPLKKRPVPTMRPPPPLSPNPATMAPRTSPKPSPIKAPFPITPRTSTPDGNAPLPRPSPKTPRPKLSRSKPTTANVIHVISNPNPTPAQSGSKVPVLNMTVEDSICKQIRNPPKKSSSK